MSCRGGTAGVPPWVFCHSCCQRPFRPAAGWERVLNRFGDTTDGGAYPAGQTLVQSPKFRQTAPEIRDCPGFVAYFGTTPQNG